jgi:hypothetical protein
MTLSLNTIITFALSPYVIWMAWSENQREKASEKTLTAQQLKTFNDSYSMSRPTTEYPSALQPHAKIAHRARIRKVVAAVILTAVLFAFIFIGP